MKDNHGFFYYPLPSNKRIKMYVRDNDGVIEFCLHSEDDPQLSKEHGWITFEAAKQASELFTGKGTPLRLYDFDVAVSVLRDAASNGG